MTNIKAIALLGAVLLTPACNKTAATPASGAAATAAVTEDEAAKAFDATVASWQSMDAARVKALYSPDITGFDYTDGPLVDSRAQWDRNQDTFVAAKLDSVKVINKRIQLLGPDAFIATSQSEGTSSAVPANNTTFRCTDVYHRDPAGNWPIVNEHCSAMPKPA